MTDKLDVQLADITWWQNCGLALFAAGLVIFGLVYAVQSNAASLSSYIQGVPYASPPTTNATVRFIFQGAAQTSDNLVVAGLICALLGGFLIAASWRRLSRLKAEYGLINKAIKIKN